MTLADDETAKRRVIHTEDWLSDIKTELRELNISEIRAELHELQQQLQYLKTIIGFYSNCCKG
jgi:hypothetical protein